MDNLLDYYSNLLETKFLQEVIATDLRDLTSKWSLKYEEEETIEIERERTSDDPPSPSSKLSENLNDLDDLDFYKQIDAILAKANESLKKDITTQQVSKKSLVQTNTQQTTKTNTISTQFKSNSQYLKKTQSNLSLNKPKPKSSTSLQQQQRQPVYLKAPYKTSIVKPTTKLSLPSKSVIQTQSLSLKKSQSTDILIAKKIEPEPVKKVSIESIATVSNKIITTETRLMTKYKSVDFKDLAMSLYLPPKLEYLSVKTTDLAIKISKKKRKQTAKQSFLNKLSENYLDETQPINILKVENIYKKTQKCLVDHLFQIDTKNTVTSYLKLKILFTYFESFSERLKQMIPKNFKNLLDNYFSNEPSNDSLIDVSLYNLIDVNCLPIVYSSSNELIRLNELECDLAEIEFKILLFNYVKTHILSELKMNQTNVDYLKLIYGFISNYNKKVIIAS